MNLKIVSDGTAIGTKLIDSDTGTTIPMVQRIEWSVNSDEPQAKCTVHLINVPVEIKAVEPILMQLDPRITLVTDEHGRPIGW